MSDQENPRPMLSKEQKDKLVRTAKVAAPFVACALGGFVFGRKSVKLPKTLPSFPELLEGYKDNVFVITMNDGAKYVAKLSQTK